MEILLPVLKFKRCMITNMLYLKNAFGPKTRKYEEIGVLLWVFFYSFAFDILVLKQLNGVDVQSINSLSRCSHLMNVDI